MNPRDLDEERRRLFRRMEWTFVYAPPILALVFGVGGAFLIAFLFPIPGTTFWVRWVAVLVVVLVLPTLAYLVKEIVRRRRGE